MIPVPITLKQSALTKGQWLTAVEQLIGLCEATPRARPFVKVSPVAIQMLDELRAALGGKGFTGDRQPDP